MKKIRIVHAITRLELGGAQGNTLYTVSHLDRERFETHLLTGSGGILDDEARAMQGVNVVFCDDLVREISPIRDIAAYRKMRAIFESIKPDIVHTHSSKAGILARLAASAAKVPVIVHTYHGFGFHRFQNAAIRSFYVAAERFACKRTHHLIFVSQENRKWADQLGLTQSCSVSVIRSGIPVASIETAKPDPEFRKSLNIPAVATVVGMIACLKPQKDPITYAKSAALVLKQKPDVHFLLVGDGELKEAVLRETENLGGHFHFLGWRRDTHQILHDLNLLVLTSLWEGLPRVLPEAIAAKVPVVATNIDGNREIVECTSAGLLAQPRSAGDFAAKILQALDSKMAVPENAGRFVRDEFDIDAMITKQENLYLKLLTKT